MYGTWFNVTAGVAVGVIALVVALLVAASPLLAVVIALALGAVGALGAAMRRSGQYLENSEGEERASPQERKAMASPGPASRGAPASGEGERAGTLPPNPGAPSREVGA